VSSNFRYVAIQPTRLGDRKKLKTASYLHDFLVDHQTDASGRVNYGRPFGYAWIRANWPGNPDDRPPARTLQRHMATLKSHGLVEVRVLGFGAGMMVRLIGSAKWQQEAAAPAQQIPLFVPPPVSIRSEKPVEKQRNSTVSQYHKPPSLAVVGRQTWGRKEVKNLTEETITAVAAVHAVPRVEKTRKELDARRRLLLDQAEMLEKKFQTSC